MQMDDELLYMITLETFCGCTRTIAHPHLPLTIVMPLADLWGFTVREFELRRTTGPRSAVYREVVNEGQRSAQSELAILKERYEELEKKLSKAYKRASKIVNDLEVL